MILTAVIGRPSEGSLILWEASPRAKTLYHGPRATSRLLVLTTVRGKARCHALGHEALS